MVSRKCVVAISWSSANHETRVVYLNWSGCNYNFKWHNAYMTSLIQLVNISIRTQTYIQIAINVIEMNSELACAIT